MCLLYTKHHIPYSGLNQIIADLMTKVSPYARLRSLVVVVSRVGYYFTGPTPCAHRRPGDCAHIDYAEAAAAAAAVDNAGNGAQPL